MTFNNISWGRKVLVNDAAESIAVNVPYIKLYMNCFCFFTLVFQDPPFL